MDPTLLGIGRSFIITIIIIIIFIIVNIIVSVDNKPCSGVQKVVRRSLTKPR
jgi:hypothetical protein